MTEIQNFYKNQTIFVTGGTGFLGKALVAKLLMACPDLKRIYLLLRPKKNKTTEERFNEYLQDTCFDGVRSTKSDFSSKLQMVEGDCDLPSLDLSPQAKRTVIDEVTIVIHAAADIKFDEKLTVSVQRNVGAVKEILNLAKQIQKLQVFLYISTAFSSAPRVEIDEEFYAPNITPDDLVLITKILDEKALEALTPHLIENRPNVYIFCKQVAEDVVRREGKSLPLAIIRPGIINVSYSEPSPGWMQGLQGLMALCVGIFLGVIRTLYCKKDVSLNIVPCDHVVNNIIAVGWDLGKEKSRSQNDIPIYNFVGYGVSLDSLDQLSKKYKYLHPSNKIIWYPNCTFTESFLWHSIHIFFYTVLAYVADGVLKCFGKNLKIVDKWSRVKRGMEVLYYFTTTKFHFTSKNVEALWAKMQNDDKKIFYFDLKNFDWNEMFRISSIYSRIYITKESPDDIENNFKRLWMFFFLHYGIILLFLSTVLYYLLKLMNWL